MDYPILNRGPDVAQAVVTHTIDANGNALPQSGSTPGAIFAPINTRGTQTLTVTASSAYASGNVVGGLLTFISMARGNGLGGVIQSVVLKDKAGQNVSYDLFLFDAPPTAPVDKTAIALTAADLAKCIGVVPISGAALGAASTMGILTAASLGLAYKITTVFGGYLYGILVTRGTPTYASTSDVSVDLIALPD
jgi:hypothetical protein